jgi:outer membrane cobalamin receptor
MDAKPNRRGALLGALALVGLAAWGCAPNQGKGAANPAAEHGQVITRADISRFRVTNAWEAVRRGATHLVMREGSRGGPDRITHRGATSFRLSPDVLFVVDGTVLADHNALRDIRAETISYIRILSGTEGTRDYGTGGGNGVVVIATAIPME